MLFWVRPGAIGHLPPVAGASLHLRQALQQLQGLGASRGTGKLSSEVLVFAVRHAVGLHGGLTDRFGGLEKKPQTKPKGHEGTN